jgi:DNA polymerase
MNTYALDFESYYDSDCSITTLGPKGYFSHPAFDAYMVSVVSDSGYEFVGNPREFDWSVLDGQRVISHNAAFDESLYLFGVESGWWPACTPTEWHCTADMTAFLGLPRSLKNASAAVLGIEVSKDVRSNMKGKRWETMTEEFRTQVRDYALLDSRYCLQLWQKLEDQWPQTEREISLLNRRIGQRGLPIDTDLLRKNLETIQTELFEAEQSIPWIGDYTPLSRKAFNEQCRIQGIEPPASIAMGNEEADKWFAAHQQACPWARAVQNYRRINAFLRKLEAFDNGTMPDQRYYGGLMYCGANPTARFSGSGGNLNLQNLPRDEMFGVNFRHMIRPKKGHKLIVADLSQIEVRTLCWLAGDKDALELIRESEDIYHAFGVLLSLHDPANGPLKSFDPKLRHKVKSIVLGCGYGMGPTKFATFSGLPLEEAEAAVNLYREKMSTVKRLWRKLDNDMAVAYSISEPFELDMPSGRMMRYGVLKRMKDTSSDKTRFRYIGKLIRNGQLRDFALWGGILTENLSQALARDIFCDMLLRIDKAGFPIILHVHDEVVLEVPEDTAEDALQQVLQIMSTPPDWIPDIPVAAEGHILDLYSK